MKTKRILYVAGAVFLNLWVCMQASAALVHYATWDNSWGELAGDDTYGFFGMINKEQNDPDNDWEVAIWNDGHNTAATSNMTWVDNTTYSFSLTYDKSTGDVSYRLATSGTDWFNISGTVDPGRTFNTFYIYGKNIAGNTIRIDNLKIDGLELGSLSGFDGSIHIDGSSIKHQTVKFTDADPSGILTDGVTVTGDFVIDNSGDPSVKGTQMQISAKLLDLPTPVPIPGAVWLFGSGLIGLAGLKRRFKKS